MPDIWLRVSVRQVQPDLLDYRKQFADFLDRLAVGTPDADEWSSFCVTQYHDELLEAIRRSTVRLAIGQLSYTLDSIEGRELLRAWAIKTRSFGDTA